VWRELTAKERMFFKSLNFIVVRDPSDKRLVNALQLVVDNSSFTSLGSKKVYWSLWIEYLIKVKDSNI